MNTNKNIPIGGFHKQSLIDYPGHISAVIFTCGCNFSCNYCHNPQLIGSDLIKDSDKNNEAKILDWLKENNKLLDAVVVTGGEPTLHSGLPGFLKKIKQLELKVKLDTNGSNPDMLAFLINQKQVDYIAMDVKAPLNLMKYRAIAGESFNDSLLEKIMRSVSILNSKQVDCEFRTTADSSLSVDDFIQIAGQISGSYFIQNTVNNGEKSIQKLSDLQVKKLEWLSSDKLNVAVRK